MSEEKVVTPSDPFIGVRKRVLKKLTGFSSDFPPELLGKDFGGYKPASKDFPVPELILFMMRDILGWRWQKHGEKVRWSVYGCVGGEPIVLELKKFGFTICYTAEIKASRIEGQLKSALKEVERFLEPLAAHQVDQGEVLIVNRFGEFDARYRFFRNLAGEAYARALTPPADESNTEDGIKGFVLDLSSELNRVLKNNREGFFYSTAMVDSYFSALEHRLVLLRAFTGLPLAERGLLAILNSKWDEKLKSIIPIAGNHEAEKLLGNMRRVKDRIRNPFAHGGVENDGGSLFFHLPHVGAVPANFSRFGDSVRLSFIPIESDDHAESCSIFDRLDNLLASASMAKPHRLMDAGVDPSFDQKSLEQYRGAISGDDALLESFIDHWGSEWDRHANMDY